MARIKNTDKIGTDIWMKINQKSAAIMERNDCAVKAIAAGTGVDYAKVHSLLRKAGRKNGGATKIEWMFSVLSELGFEWRFWLYKPTFMGDTNPIVTRNLHAVINNYPGQHKNLQSVTTHHPVRFAKAWQFAKGCSFIAVTSGGGHVAAIVDGEVHDWTKGRPMRIAEMWEIIPRS